MHKSFYDIYRNTLLEEEKEKLITVQCLLEFESFEDRTRVLKLMRSFSSCMRFAYQRLLEGCKRKDLKRSLQNIFPLNSRYCDDAISKAQNMLTRCKKREINPVKIIFGGKNLFEKLKKNHLQGKRREKLKRKWIEKRQGSVCSKGDKSKKGNLNLRFIFIKGELYLRINTGKGKYIYAKVYRKIQKGRREKDKWLWFIQNLLTAETTRCYKPYFVELKFKENNVYAMISFEENIPDIKITRQSGAIGIDVNASPFHIAWSEVDRDGNLKKYGKISLYELLNQSRNKRQYLLWHIAHKIIDIAYEKRKAIVIENIKKLSKGRRGDGAFKLRKRLHQFVYKRFLEKIETLARRAGIEVIKVNPAYTSIIGEFKYCPQYLIDKDIAASYVIGRRGLGFADEIPENYKDLLSRKEFLEYALEILESKKKEFKNKLGSEKNKWKKVPIRKELLKIHNHLKEVKNQFIHISSEGDSVSRDQASVGNKPVRGFLKSWRVLRAAFTFPLLGKSFVRDFSPLRRVIVLGDWEGVVRRLVPAPGAGAQGWSKTARWG